MGALSNYLESGILRHVLNLGGSAVERYSTVHIGLVRGYDANSLESGVLTSEVTTGGYVRQAYTSSASTWMIPYNSGTATATHNQNAIEFPPATADIGNVSGVIITDSSTTGAGNILFYGQLSNDRNIRTNDQFVFSSGALKITFD
jgi:hypothetical protein